MHRFFLVLLSLCVIVQNSRALPIFNNHDFDLTTATIKDVRDAIRTGRVTCFQIIKGYLDRIQQYNNQGPQLAAVVTTNQKALKEAILLDVYFLLRRNFKGALHCVPLLVKDNIDVAGLPTTNGMSAFDRQIPKKDAYAVQKMKASGAIVIGKANLTPFANREAYAYSETGGLVRNPFGLNYTTYGSSAGNGAAGASMLTILGMGTETGFSIMLPASAANLIGFRPQVDTQLTEGVMPTNLYQDVVGFLAKRAEDVATATQVLLSNQAVATPLHEDQNFMETNWLNGLKVNVFEQLVNAEFDIPRMGHYKVEQKIKELFQSMIANFETGGAIVTNSNVDTDLIIPSIAGMFAADYTPCVAGWRDQYLNNTQRFGPSAPYHSVADVVASNKLPAYYQAIWNQTLVQSSVTNCANKTEIFNTARAALFSNIINPLLEDVDLAIWPALPNFPSQFTQDALNRNWTSTPPVTLVLVGPFSGWPSLSLPMGFSDPLPDAPRGLPIGAMLFARPEKYSTLLKVAYAYQQRFGVTKLPAWVLPDKI